MAQSFNKAFTAARKDKGAGGVFTWNGKKYTTNYKEDKAGKSKADDKAPTKAPTKAAPKAAPKAPTKYTGPLAGKGFTPPPAKKPSFVNSKGLPKADKKSGGQTTGARMVSNALKGVGKDGQKSGASMFRGWVSGQRDAGAKEREARAAAKAKARSTKAAKGGCVKKLAKGGRVGDGCAQRGRTKGTIR